MPAETPNVEKSVTIGATKTTMKLTEHGSVYFDERCGPSRVELYVPIELVEIFMAAYAATDYAKEKRGQTTPPPA